MTPPRFVHAPARRLLATLAVAAGTAAAPGAGAQGPATAPPFDPYDPVKLEAFAMERFRKGDTTTAWILLERAARLSPRDASIARHRDEVDAARQGVSAPAPAPGTQRAPSAARARTVPAEPPALWPAR